MALDQVKDEKEMSFLDHIDDLRKHLFRAAIVLLICGIGCFIYTEFIVEAIIFAPSRADFITKQWLCQLSQYLYQNDNLCLPDIVMSTQNINIAGQFLYSFRIAIIGGLVISFPFLIHQIWLFIKPALSKKEVKKMRLFTFYTSLLFLTGVLFGYYILSPISLNFFGTFKLSSTIENKFSFQSVINLVTMLCLGTGLIFQLPIVMYFLGTIGLLSVDFLKKNRRYAIVIIFFIAAIITPPDVMSQFILAIPLLGLYELGIYIVKNIEKRKANE